MRNPEWELPPRVPPRFAAQALRSREMSKQLIRMSKANQLGDAANALVLVHRLPNADHQRGQVLLPVSKRRPAFIRRLDIHLDKLPGVRIKKRDQPEVAVKRVRLGERLPEFCVCLLPYRLKSHRLLVGDDHGEENCSA